MARAGRKKRLPISIASGLGASWSPSEDCWSRIEKAYGEKLDDSARVEIAAIVNRYFAACVFERSAGLEDSAIDWLAGVEKAAIAFVAACISSGGGGGRPYAASIMSEFMSETGAKAPRPAHFVRVMTEIANAASAASTRISSEDHAHIKDHDAWRRMARDLWQFASKRDLPNKIDKSGRSKTLSPFVSFVAELQRSLDPAQAEFMHSDEGLAGQLSSATRGLRPKREIKSAES